jgi:hypothetical protein
MVLGCEIKSYDTSNITLGKFAGDKENVALLNKVFGILTYLVNLTRNLKSQSTQVILKHEI